MGEPVSHLVRPVPPALAPFVSSIGYYQGRFRHGRERALATGGTQLLVNLAGDELWWHPDGGGAQRTAGAAVQGASTRPGLVDPAHQREIVCVVFRPGGAYPFLPVPAAELQGRLVHLGELWGRDGATLRERLLAATTPAGRLRVLEAALLARVVRPIVPDQAVLPDRSVTAAALALHRGVTVTQVCDDLGWTRQRLARRFAEQVGMAPKRFARIRRFQRLLWAVGAGGGYGRDADWARLAAMTGYHDQAHMIHDFHTFAGLRPSAYAPRSADERNHVPM